MLRGDGDDPLALTPRFIADERDHLSPSGRENGPVETRFGFRAIGQKASLGIPLGFGAFGHGGDVEVFEHHQVRLVVRDQSVTGLMRIVLAHMLFVLLVPGDMAIGFFRVFGTFLTSRGFALPFFVLPSLLLDTGFLHRLQIKNLTRNMRTVASRQPGRFSASCMIRIGMFS